MTSLSTTFSTFAFSLRSLPNGVWKEWRDHRGVIVAYLGVTPLLLLLFGSGWLGFEGMRGDGIAVLGVLWGFAIAALAFGSDLVPGEVRRGNLAFLSRLPGDLGGAFAAKLLFFAAMLALFAFWTGGGCALAHGIFHGGGDRPWLPRIDRSGRESFAAIGGALLVAATWLFAVSCWMVRGTFALPAAAIVLAAALAPVFGAFRANPAMKLHSGEFACGASWLVASGLAVAALSFRRGWRFGGTIRARIVWSLVPALVAFAPVWGWSVLRVREHHHLDPSEVSFRLAAPAIGAGGRFAFVNGYHSIAPPERAGDRPEFSASHPLIVDVATGAWREVGEPGDLFRHLGRASEAASARVVLVVADEHDTLVPLSSQFSDGLDGATGERLTAEQWKPILRGARGDGESAFTLLPDGRRAWAVDGHVFTRTPDGVTRELPCDRDERWIGPVGHGFLGGTSVYDCSQERALNVDAAGLDAVGLIVRAGGWVARRMRPRSQPPLYDWVLWNPATRAFTPAIGLERGSPIALHPDGRLLVVEPAATSTEERSATGSLCLLDPETGARVELPLPAALAARIAIGANLGFTAAEDLLLLLHGTETEQQWIARFDPRRDELACVGPFRSVYPNVVGCPDRDTVVFVDDSRRLVRAHFDGRPTELLFPR